MASSQTAATGNLAAADRLLICSACGKMATDQGQLADHMTSHVTSAVADAKARMSGFAAGFKAVVCNLTMEVRSVTFQSTQDLPTSAAAISTSIPDEAVVSREISAFNSNLNVLSLNIALGKWQQKRAFECRFCGQRFRFRLAAVDHVNLHTDDRPYKCRYCNVVSHSSPARSMHERRQHSEKLLQGSEAAGGAGSVEANGDQADRGELDSGDGYIGSGPAPSAAPSFCPCVLCGAHFADFVKLQLHLQAHHNIGRPHLPTAIPAAPAMASAVPIRMSMPPLCRPSGGIGGVGGVGGWRPIQLRPTLPTLPTLPTMRTPGFRPIFPRPSAALTQVRMQLPILVPRSGAQ